MSRDEPGAAEAAELRTPLAMPASDSGETSPEAGQKFRLPRWILRAVGPLLFIALWWFSDLDTVRSLATGTRAWPLLGAAALNIAIILVKSWRWRGIMRIQDIDFPYMLAVRSYTIAAALAAWTPGRLGDFSKALSVSRASGVSFGSAASSVIADRLLDALVLTLVAAAGAGAILGPVAATVTWSLVALAVVIGYMLIRWASVAGSARTVQALGRVGLSSAGAEVEAALAGLQTMTRPSGRKVLILALPATGVATLLTFIQGYLVAVSLGLPVPFLRLASGLGAASIASLLPLSVSGIGLREATLAVFMSGTNIQLGEVLAFSVAFLLVVNGSVALIGALTHAIWPLPGGIPRAGEEASGGELGG